MQATENGPAGLPTGHQLNRRHKAVGVFPKLAGLPEAFLPPQKRDPPVSPRCGSPGALRALLGA